MDYKQKYLKYKNKYLDLKSSQERPLKEFPKSIIKNDFIDLMRQDFRVLLSTYLSDQDIKKIRSDLKSD